MITKLNPQSVNENWGGVLPLKLGNNTPNNFNEIISAIKHTIDGDKFYNILIYDTEENIYFGEPEVITKNVEFVEDTSNYIITYIITQFRPMNNKLYNFRYLFKYSTQNPDSNMDISFESYERSTKLLEII